MGRQRTGPWSLREETCRLGDLRPQPAVPASLLGMPKSKGRKKAKRRPTPPKQPSQAAARDKGPSPTWYVVLMFGLMVVGILLILANYANVLPGGTQNIYLVVGLAGIAIGFAMTLNYR